MIARARRVVARLAGALAGSAVLTRVGLLAVWVLLGMAIIVAVVWCWTVASDRRARNTAVVLVASRGRLPHPGPVTGGRDAPWDA